MVAKVPKPTLKLLNRMNHYTIEIYDKFLELNTIHPQPSLIFKPNILPNDEYNEHLHQNLPDFHELFRDRDMMIAFREFLYEKCTYENLSFYLNAEVLKITPEDQVERVAMAIYDTYFSPSASTPLNIDFSLSRKLNEEKKKT